VGSVFTHPTSADTWGGFANEDLTLYPIVLSSDATISFTASVPSGEAVDVRFRFEFNTFPNTDPAYDTSVVTVSGSAETVYTIDVPSQGANTFSSFLMYLDTKDIGVSVSNVIVSVGDSAGEKALNVVKKLSNQSGLAGTSWVVNPINGAISSGVAEFDSSRYQMTQRAMAKQACGYIEEFHFNADGTFEIFRKPQASKANRIRMSTDCVGSLGKDLDLSGATYAYDAVNGTLTVNGRGAYVAKHEVVNGQIIRSPGEIPSQVIYNVYPALGGGLLLTIDAGFDGWWSFLLKRTDEATFLPN
jgi:hypothetical protein